MSHFYGTLRGRGLTTATRTGTKNGGLIATAAGWGGAVRVTLSHTVDGQDQFTVELIPWQGSRGESRTLAEGLLDAGSAQVSGMRQRSK